MRMTQEQVDAHQARVGRGRACQVIYNPKPIVDRPSKYRAQRTVVDGITFASKKEAARYGVLKTMEAAREIEGLTLQPTFDLVVNGVLVCRYKADFQYREGGALFIEDVKGMKTPAYRLKKKLMKAIHNIDIFET